MITVHDNYILMLANTLDSQVIKSIIYLFVGVSVLLVGMKMMSGGLKKAVGKGLRSFFKRTETNPIVGVGIGTAVTTIIQSSDATAALVIGFINAGAMTIYQGLTIILGGYIGTTITAVLASFSSLSISIYLLIFSFLGMIMMMFFKNDKVKNIGEILCGFGFLFFGLAVMKDSFNNEAISSALSSLFQSINFPLLLFLIGVIVAALVQSSSAIAGITIGMVGGGTLALSEAMYIVLGAMLGTVANTLLTSLNSSIEGKRTAYAALFIKATTSILGLIVLVIFEDSLVNFFQLFQIKGSSEFPLAMFTVLFNLIFMMLILPFLKPIIKLMNRIVKESDRDGISSVVHYIDDNLLKSPDIAIMQVRKEIVNMYDIAFLNYKYAIDKILSYSNEHTKDIIKLEDQTDYLNQRITDFLIKLANVASKSDETKVGTDFHVINDIERIGDHAYNFHEFSERMNEEGLSFSDAAKKEILELDKIIQDMFIRTREIFVTKDRSKLEALHDEEEKTDDLKTAFYSHHYERVIKDECSQKMTPYISSLIVELERIADHLVNIAYSIVNPTGEDK